ncbi:class I SAM-dependent methyltransferase [Amphibacillus cookii]|uniref:class I SAM-dependent methyltransferase n=1 Tax=Amphibacillus cookii TaxID=767787 RepID=UPI00195BB532|nr:class I SAM-dependent methyltransferase [Amphibacillus cookii]MBM7542267.1 tRNA (cmo5U34)-methyltransferase [Amphibacillus cookii]
MKNTNWNSPTVQKYQQTIRNKIPGYDLMYEQMLAIIEASLAPQELLIVGAGGGQELLILGNRYPQAFYTALDPSENMLELARKRISYVSLKVDWQETTLDNISIKKQYDVVTCHLVLHFLKEEKEAFLEQISKKVKPEGLLFISAIMEEEKTKTLPFWIQHMKFYNISVADCERFAASFNKTTHPLPTSMLQKILQRNGYETIIPYFKSYAIEAYVAKKGVKT